MADTLQTIPARASIAARLRAGQDIRVINTHGQQGVDTWAFATADARDPDIIQVVAQLPKHAHAKLSTFTSQGLANTCWALATLGVGSAEDLTPFAREIEARADEFKPQVRLFFLLVSFVLYRNCQMPCGPLLDYKSPTSASSTC